MQIAALLTLIVNKHIQTEGCGGPVLWTFRDTDYMLSQSHTQQLATISHGAAPQTKPQLSYC